MAIAGSIGEIEPYGAADRGGPATGGGRQHWTGPYVRKPGTWWFRASDTVFPGMFDAASCCKTSPNARSQRLSSIVVVTTPLFSHRRPVGGAVLLVRQPQCGSVNSTNVRDDGPEFVLKRSGGAGRDHKNFSARCGSATILIAPAYRNERSRRGIRRDHGERLRRRYGAGSSRPPASEAPGEASASRAPARRRTPA